MKRKTTRVKQAPTLTQRLAGIAYFRITGPSRKTGERVTREILGTREEAESLVLE